MKVVGLCIRNFYLKSAVDYQLYCTSCSIRSVFILKFTVLSRISSNTSLLILSICVVEMCVWLCMRMYSAFTFYTIQVKANIKQCAMTEVIVNE